MAARPAKLGSRGRSRLRGLRARRDLGRDRRARPRPALRAAREGAEARRPLGLRRRRGVRARQPPHGEARPRRLEGRRPALRRVPRDGLRQPGPPRQVARAPCTRRSSTTRTRPACAGRPARASPTTTTPTRPARRAAAATSRSSSSTGKTLGEWQHKTFLTPIMPMGALHEEMYEWGGLAKVTTWNFELLGERITNDQRTFGPGMMGFFVKAAVIDRKIPAYVETPVRELVTENGRVIGVRAERKDGSSFFVRRREGRAARRRRLRPQQGHGVHVREHARLARRLPRLPRRRPPGDGPRDRRRDRLGAADESRALLRLPDPRRGVRGPPALPLVLGVRLPPRDLGEPAGSSASATSPSTRTTSRARAAWDGKKQEQPNLQPYLIFDGNYRERYPLGSFMPGQPLPEGMVVQADTPRELAAKLGIDPDGLRADARALQPVRGEGRRPGLRQGLAALGGAAGGRPLLPEPERRPAEQAAVPRA